jgi:hypothetical protein
VISPGLSLALGIAYSLKVAFAVVVGLLVTIGLAETVGLLITVGLVFACGTVGGVVDEPPPPHAMRDKQANATTPRWIRIGTFPVSVEP